MQGDPKSKLDKLGNNYFVDECVGEGGQAKVYLVKDKNENKYALKIFKKFQGKELEKYYKNEINILDLLKSQKCPYIINKIDSGRGFFTVENKSVNYIILEYAEKGMLFDYILYPNEGLGEKKGKWVFYKILKGIDFCHKLGICHRDLKLENILLDTRFNPKINDFGLRKIITGENDNYLEEKVGTEKYYMCPEMLKKKVYNGFKADIFSLGVILMIIVINKYPFKYAKKSDSNYELIAHKKFDKFWNMFNNQNISENFKDLYIKMVQYNGENRPTIDEVMNHKWFEEIKKISEEEKKSLQEEFVKEFLAREEIVKKQKNLKIEIEENEKKIDSNACCKSDNNSEIFFTDNIKPKKYNNKYKYIMENYLIIQGKINPVNFMNQLCNLLKEKNNNIVIEESTKNLSFILIFEEKDLIECEENEYSEVEEQKLKIKLFEITSEKEYILNFKKKGGNYYDFYNNIKLIKEIIDRNFKKTN